MSGQSIATFATLGVAAVAAAASIATYRQGKRAEKRATERHDVTWVAEVEDRDVTVSHAGVDQAHDVTLIVRWYENTVRAHRAIMANGDELGVQIDRLQYVPGIGTTMPNVCVTVTWRTESGSPREWSTVTG